MTAQFSIFRLDETAKKVTPLAKDAGFNGTLAGSALSPDGQRIALGHSFSGGLHVFDTTTGRPIAGHMSAHASSISAIAFSSDGAKLATADSEGTIKIWQDARKLTSKSAALMTLKGHQGAITAVRFSIDGKRLVTTSVDKTARVWDLENAGVAIRQLEGTSKDWSFLARFSSDGHWIAAAGGNRVRLWDTATGRLVRELSAGDNSSIFSVAFSPTDNRLLAVGYGGQADVSYVALWDIDAGAELVRLPGATDLPGFPASADSRVVGALAFSPDGKYLVAGFGVKWTLTPGGPPRPLKVWEVANRRQILLNGHTGFCMSLDFSRDGKLLASGSRDGTAILWSTATWKRVQTLQNPDNESLSGQSGRGMVEGVAFSPDGKTLAMAGREGNVHLWDVASGKLLETLKGHSSAVNAVVFSPDGRTLASGSTDHTVRLWNVQTRRQLMQLDPGNIELGDVGVLTLAFSPDGMHLLAGRVGGSFFWSAAPIVWNDPDRAAEKLRLLLQSNADFQSRIRMLSEHARLYEALEKLEKLAPNDVRVQIELAVARARRLAAQGNAALADAARTKARLLLEQKLAQEPEIPTWAVELADLLLIDNPARWTILKPVEAKSEPGATLSILPDDSILASGTNPLKDRYRVVLTVANDIDLTAIRLEALTYPSLPGNGPGRNSVGSFAQTSWNVTATSRDRKEPIRLPFDNALRRPSTCRLPDQSGRILEHLRRPWSKLYGGLVDVKARLPRSGHDVDLPNAVPGREWRRRKPRPIPAIRQRKRGRFYPLRGHADHRSVGETRRGVSRDRRRAGARHAAQASPGSGCRRRRCVRGRRGLGTGDSRISAGDYRPACRLLVDQARHGLPVGRPHARGGRLSGEGVRRQSERHVTLPEGRRSPGVVRTGEGTRRHPAADPRVRQGHQRCGHGRARGQGVQYPAVHRQGGARGGAGPRSQGGGAR